MFNETHKSYTINDFITYLICKNKDRSNQERIDTWITKEEIKYLLYIGGGNFKGKFKVTCIMCELPVSKDLIQYTEILGVGQK